jgi:hypothetical protein
MNIPPPCSAVRYGNLHIHPRPTAVPAAVKIKLNEPENPPRPPSPMVDYRTWNMIRIRIFKI